jgi:hypothetical protein
MRTPRQLARALKYLTGTPYAMDRVTRSLREPDSLPWSALPGDKDRMRELDSLVARSVNQDLPTEHRHG